jgi:hypothetical protein
MNINLLNNSNSDDDNNNEEVRLTRENMQYELYQTYNRSYLSHTLSIMFNIIFGIVSLLQILLFQYYSTECNNTLFDYLSIYTMKCIIMIITCIKIIDHNRIQIQNNNNNYTINSHQTFLLFICMIMKYFCFYLGITYLYNCFYLNLWISSYIIIVSIRECISIIIPMFFGLLPSCCHNLFEYLVLRSRPYFRVGSDEEIIQNLPIYLYNGEYEDDLTNYDIKGENIFIQSSKSNCIICFDDYINNEEIKMLPCDHFYHNKCINSWLQISQTCPLCRRNIVTNRYSIEDTDSNEDEDELNV